PNCERSTSRTAHWCEGKGIRIEPSGSESSHASDTLSWRSSTLAAKARKWCVFHNTPSLFRSTFCEAGKSFAIRAPTHSDGDHFMRLCRNIRPWAATEVVARACDFGRARLIALPDYRDALCPKSFPRFHEF